MNGNIFTSNGKDFKSYYIFHFVVYGIIIIFNSILLLEVYWIHSLYYYIYLALIIFGTLYFIEPIIPFLYILLQKLNEKKVKLFKALSFIFCSLVLLTGLSFTIILMMNAMESTDFCRECPFNLDDSFVNKIYNDYLNKNLEGKNLQKECINRRCIFNNNIIANPYPIEYMCNYEASKEFDTIKNSSNRNQTIPQILCEKIENNINSDFENENVNNFMKMCHSFDEFYICKRLSEPKSYTLKHDFHCPNKKYLKYLIFFCLAGVILNLFIGFIPWKMEYSKYKKMILIIRQISQRQPSKSQNTTRNTADIKTEQAEESFKKEPTQTIIIYNETEQNLEPEKKIVPKENKINENKKITLNKNKNDLKNTTQISKNVSSKILNIMNVKQRKKSGGDKNEFTEKCKKDDNLKVFKINDTPVKKKESKKRLGKKDEEELVYSTNPKISIYSDRNMLEESKTVQEE